MTDDPRVTLDAASTGDRQARRAVRDAIDLVAPDHAAMAPWLDGLAMHAAEGSEAALSDLLSVVDDHRLARPAVRRLVIDDTDAEDVLQDVLIAVARSISNFRGDARFTTWLHTVARNTAIGYLRKRDAAKHAGEMEIETEARRISSMIANRETLRHLLDQLPEIYREPIILRDVQQLDYQQVADTLELNLNTVKSRIARGRALLATMVPADA